MANKALIFPLILLCKILLYIYIFDSMHVKFRIQAGITITFGSLNISLMGQWPVIYQWLCYNIAHIHMLWAKQSQTRCALANVTVFIARNNHRPLVILQPISTFCQPKSAGYWSAKLTVQFSIGWQSISNKLSHFQEDDWPISDPFSYHFSFLLVNFKFKNY